MDDLEEQTSQSLGPEAWLRALQGMHILRYVYRVLIRRGFQSEFLDKTIDVPSDKDGDFTHVEIDLIDPTTVDVGVRADRLDQAISTEEEEVLEGICRDPCFWLLIQHQRRHRPVRDPLRMWRRVLRIADETHSFSFGEAETAKLRRRGEKLKEGSISEMRM